MKRFEFEGEFFSELVELDGQQMEHVGFRSKDGSFEETLNSLADGGDLPRRARLIIEMLDEQ